MAHSPLYGDGGLRSPPRPVDPFSDQSFYAIHHDTEQPALASSREAQHVGNKYRHHDFSPVPGLEPPPGPSGLDSYYYDDDIHSVNRNEPDLVKVDGDALAENGAPMERSAKSKLFGQYFLSPSHPVA